MGRSGTEWQRHIRSLCVAIVGMAGSVVISALAWPILVLAGVAAMLNELIPWLWPKLHKSRARIDTSVIPPPASGPQPASPGYRYDSFFLPAERPAIIPSGNGEMAWGAWYQLAGLEIMQPITITAVRLNDYDRAGSVFYAKLALVLAGC
jgi:hypothetical protein